MLRSEHKVPQEQHPAQLPFLKSIHFFVKADSFTLAMTSRHWELKSQNSTRPKIPICRPSNPSNRVYHRCNKQKDNWNGSVIPPFSYPLILTDEDYLICVHGVEIWNYEQRCMVKHFVRRINKYRLILLICSIIINVVAITRWIIDYGVEFDFIRGESTEIGTGE